MTKFYRDPPAALLVLTGFGIGAAMLQLGLFV